MARTRIEWDRIFALLHDRRYGEARDVIKKEPGTRVSLAEQLGVEGLISVLSRNEVEMPLSRLKELTRSRLNSVFSDDFDRAYFLVFRRFVQFLGSEGVASATKEQESVVEDPAKQKQHNVASKARSD